MGKQPAQMKFPPEALKVDISITVNMLLPLLQKVGGKEEYQQTGKKDNW